MNNIDILEEKIKIIESLCTDDCINKETVIKPLKYAISTLIAENKELKEEIEELKIIKSGIQALETNFANDDTYYVIGKRGFFKGEYRKLLDDYIPKSKIKAKIEECEKDIEIYNNYEENWHKIEVLQSLLEKE